MEAKQNGYSMIWWARDPASAISHLVGFILAVSGTVVLVGKGMCIRDSLYAGAFAVFGIAMVLLYLSSTLYHWLNLGEIGTLALRKLDHAMIYVMIAGTYTPLCIIALSGIWGNGLLIAIWALAVGGIFLTLFWLEAPRWLTTSIYILMGWLALVAIVPLIRVLPVDGFIWLLGGGIFYTIGGVIYGRKKSLINLPGFGFHEVFHIFVLAGSICHYLLMLLVLVKL